LTIPAASLKQSVAIIGRTGSGKTYTAKGLVEQLLRDQARVCIIDPLGVWWGLRSSVDGTKPAFPIVVFGGDHADVPLTDGMGAALAGSLGTANIPAIVDVSEFSMAGRVRFVTAFLEELYQVNRSPLTLVIDEADMFAPQRPQKDQLTMLGRMETICRRGRVRGFRPWLITQRPASLHKACLSQANTLIAMQLTAPQDRDALGDWIEGQADREQGKRVLADLPKLPRGQGFVWAPHESVLERVKFPAITTYDSSRTPEDGETLPQVKLAPVDLSKLGAMLQKADEGPDADDPRELRARIAELEEQLAGGTPEPDPEALEEAEKRGYGLALDAVAKATERLVTLAAAITETITGFQEDLQRLASKQVHITCTSNDIQNDIEEAARLTRESAGRIRIIPENMPKLPRAAARDAGGGAQRRMMIALAQNPGGLSGRKLSILADVKRGGSTWRGALAAMRKDGLVSDDGETFELTPAGKKALGKYEPLPTGDALRDHWRAKMGNGSRRSVFEEILSAYPKEISQAEIARRAGVELGGSTWRGHLAFMRGLELVTGRDKLRASDDLFQ
jgi:hypothetical protein